MALEIKLHAVLILKALNSGQEKLGQQGFSTLADIYLRTGNFKKNVLRYYSRTTQGNETNDTPFESPIKQLLNLVIKVGVAVSKRQPRPCECKSTTLSKIEFMPLSVENFSVSKLESIAMFWGFLLRYITFPQVNWLRNGDLSKFKLLKFT